MYRKTFPAVVHTLSISIPLSAELMFIDTQQAAHKTYALFQFTGSELFHTPRCFSRGLSSFHNPKQQKAEERAVPEPGRALCMLSVGHYRPTLLLELPLLWEVLHSLPWPI